jgi:CheY-like chemotaxis protein
LIADDHEVVRSGLRAILEAHNGWEVVAEAENGKDAIAKAVESQPDVAIIDYSLPVMNGIEATRQIHARIPNAEILIFTMHDSDVLVGELLEAGARAYLLKSDAKQYLIAAVEALADHKPFFSPAASRSNCSTPPGDPPGQARGGAIAARAGDRAVDRRGPQQSGNERDPESQRQDGRDPPRGGDAEIESQIDRRAGALRRPQSASGTVGPNHHDSTIIVIYLYLFRPRQNVTIGVTRLVAASGTGGSKWERKNVQEQCLIDFVDAALKRHEA